MELGRSGHFQARQLRHGDIRDNRPVPKPACDAGRYILDSDFQHGSLDLHDKVFLDDIGD